MGDLPDIQMVRSPQKIAVRMRMRMRGVRLRRMRRLRATFGLRKGKAMMRSLIINGSPRRNGTIGTMMRVASETLGPDAELVHIGDCRIAPCTACMRCRETGECSLPHDDGHDLAEKIRNADLLVIGSPTHWGGMSAPLKNLFDRNVPVFMGESARGIPVARQKGKRALIVAACTTPYPFNIWMKQSRGTVRALREILRTGGYRTASIEIGGTKRFGTLPSRYPERLKRKLWKILRKTADTPR